MGCVSRSFAIRRALGLRAHAYERLLRAVGAEGLRAGCESGYDGARPSWARLLPEMHKPRGFPSYHSGKWHEAGKALQNGFDPCSNDMGDNEYPAKSGTKPDPRPPSPLVRDEVIEIVQLPRRIGSSSATLGG